MNLKKCARCGSFYNSDDNVCPNCKTKDEKDKLSLKSYFTNNDMPDNVEQLSLGSGVYPKNINRLIKSKEFSNEQTTFESMTQNNLSIEL